MIAALNFLVDRGSVAARAWGDSSIRLRVYAEMRMPALFFRLHRTLPVFNRDLLGAGNCQLRRRHLFDNRRTGRDGGSRAYGDRRDQHAVRSRVHVILDGRAMLIGAIVVGNDGAGTNVHTLTQRSIADVRQVVGLGIVSHLSILHLDEIADVHAMPQRRYGPEPGKRSNIAVRSDHRTVDDATSEHLGV